MTKGYYKWKATEKVGKSRGIDADLKEHILAIHRIRPYYDIRMRTALRKKGLYVNSKKVRNLIHEPGIRSVIRKKRSFDGRTPFVLFDNVLNRQFMAD
ncbi:IS3 family transposase [Brevibacillus panacihumi]|uniref:IS3 family transposase n=1 Tax=Brevibacillus panacihumi TaxID=497735 RepID=UPI003D1C7DF4